MPFFMYKITLIIVIKIVIINEKIFKYVQLIVVWGPGSAVELRKTVYERIRMTL